MTSLLDTEAAEGEDTGDCGRGSWFAPAHPPTGPGVLEPFRFGLRRLYELRLAVDDDAVPSARASAETGVQTVQCRLGEIDQRTPGGHP